VEVKATSLLIVVFVLLASGCTLPDTGNSNDNEDNGDTTSLPEDRGLKIVNFRMTDETLRPSQPAQLNLRLKNYHVKPVDIQDISIYNTGLLTVENRTCNPAPSDLGTASEVTQPEMECSWDVEAPPEEDYGGFSSKPASLNLHLEYDSYLTNQKPFKVEFKSIDDINETQAIASTFSNAEVQMRVETETPVPLKSGKTVEISVKEVGKGRLAANSEYSFEYSPSNMFDSDCTRSDAPVVGNTLEFECGFEGDREGTRNLLFSASYRYVKEPVLDRIKLEQ
jgi:hypothetical protein